MTTPAKQLTIRITWLGIVNYLGALLATGWMLYLVYASAGAVYALLALLVSGFMLRFGPLPLLIIPAGILYFHFDAAGIWLPAACWLAAGAAFMKDLRDYRKQQSSEKLPANPQRSGQKPPTKP